MTKWTKSKRWKTGIGVTLMLWGVLFIVLGTVYKSRSHLTEEIHQIPASMEEKINPLPIKQNIPIVGHFNKANEQPRSAAEIAIVDSWFKKVGYDLSNLNVYRSYSDKQLLDLAANGDSYAMEVVAENYIDKGNRADAKTYLEKSIIYGSLRAIGTVANISSPPIYEGTQAPYEESKAQLKEAFAYNEILRFRGDVHAADVYRKPHLELFEKIYDKKDSISHDDEIWIQSRAKELYEQYQAQRYKLGLGDFDNETPKEVRDFLEK